MKQSHTYQIRVAGSLDAIWSDRLGGLEIICESKEGERAETVLRGPLPDQAALVGVLETLYELHLPVLSLAIVDRAEGTGTVAGAGEGLDDS